LATLDFAAVRLNPDGSLDTGFDGDGRQIIAGTGSTIGSNGASAVAIDAAGRVVMVGSGPGGRSGGI